MSSMFTIQVDHVVANTESSKANPTRCVMQLKVDLWFTTIETKVQQRQDKTILGVYLYCLRIWIPKITGSVWSHLPEIIHMYCLWKVRKVFCIISDEWPHQKRLWYTRYLAVLKKKTAKKIFFICKSKSETMDFLTNQGNTDTGIRLKINTLHVLYLFHHCLKCLNTQE
jgi:hypothetical protein